MRCLVATVALLMAGATVHAAGDAKPFPRDEQGSVQFQAVVEVEGVGVPEFYRRAKMWVATAFRSAQDVIQLDDPTAGTVIIKGTTSVPFSAGTAWYRFTLTIEMKEGRYRWTINQIEYRAGTATGYWPLESCLTKAGVGVFGQKAIHERFRQSMLATAKDLEKAMKAPATKDDEW